MNKEHNIRTGILGDLRCSKCGCTKENIEDNEIVCKGYMDSINKILLEEMRKTSNCIHADFDPNKTRLLSVKANINLMIEDVNRDINVSN